MKACLIVVGCLIIGVLLGLPVGWIAYRLYLYSPYAPALYRSPDEPMRTLLAFVYGGASLGALLGMLVGALAVRAEGRGV
jgi:hypothetical protein